LFWGALSLRCRAACTPCAGPAGAVDALNFRRPFFKKKIEFQATDSVSSEIGIGVVTSPLGVGIAGFVVYLVSASVPIVFAENLHLFLVNKYKIRSRSNKPFLYVHLFSESLPSQGHVTKTHTAYSATLKVEHLSMFADQHELALRDTSNPRYHKTLTGENTRKL